MFRFISKLLQIGAFTGLRKRIPKGAIARRKSALHGRTKLPLPTQTPYTMSMKKVALSSLDVAGKRVLIRVDFNVPQDKKDPSVITNTARCARAAPTAARHGSPRVRP